MERRWGFEEADEADWRPVEVAEGRGLVGEDADGVVAVTVNDVGEVVAVRLRDGWQETEVRRGLGGRVVDAVSAAGARVLGRRAGELDVEPAASVTHSGEGGPITPEHVARLLHAVSGDLARFRERLAAADETVTVVSGGEHVTVSGRRGQVLDVSVDQDWLYRARASEVESELREALAGLGTASARAELALGPRSGAISELLALVADPGAMVRRIRQGAAS